MLDLERRMAEIREKGLYRRMQSFTSEQGPRVKLGGKEVINLCSNNYLGIAGRAEMKEALKKAVDEWGVGTGGSRLIGGTAEPHRKLEKDIAELKQTEDALVFNCGYVANTAALQALAGAEYTLLSDSLNHASIVDGCRLARAGVVVYEHGNIDDLREKGRGVENGIIVTDGVFSMTGEVADLGGLKKVSKELGFPIYLDDAHATGVLGETGRGTTELYGVDVDVNMGTFSKALGAHGGFVAGSSELIEFLTNTARGLIYSTAFPAPLAAAASKGLELSRDPGLRDALFRNIEEVRSGVEGLGFELPASHPTPIIPLVVGNNSKVVRMSELMLERGVFCHAIRYPTVPEEEAMLRMTVMAAHTQDDIETGLRVLRECIKEAGL